MIVARTLACVVLLLALAGTATAQDDKIVNENAALRERVAEAARRIEEANRRVAEMEARAELLARQVEQLKQRVAEPPPHGRLAPASQPPPKPRPVRNNLPLRLVLELTDLSRVVGTPNIKAVPVRTSYATMDIPFEKIQTVDISNAAETASLELRNGDRLKGTVVLDGIEVTTVFGKVAIVAKHITRLTVLAAGEDFGADHPATVGAAEIEARMKKIVIPEVDFRGANIGDVIDFLQDVGFQFNKKTAGPPVKGVTMVLKLGGVAPPLITFSARYISLYEAVRIVTEVANLRYRIENGIVIIEPK